MTVRSVLVTGGAGFIGSCFVRKVMASMKLRVIVLDELTYASSLDALGIVANHSRFVFQQGAIEDRTLVAHLLAQYQPQAIIHFAAESHVDRSIAGPADFVTTNVVGTFELLEAAKQYWTTLPVAARDEFRFLHVSTDEVYGALGDDGQFTEQSAYAPNSPYSASKAAADHFVRAYFKTYGFPTLVTHFSNNLGPYQHPEKLIPLMISRAVVGKPLPIYGDGRQVRDWIFVEDTCDATMRILSAGRPGSVYNVGGGAERSNLEVVKAICAEIDALVPDLPHKPTSSLIEFVADRPGHDRRYAMDTTKIEQELGWRPKHDFDTALRKTVRWYLDNQAWVQKMADDT